MIDDVFSYQDFAVLEDKRTVEFRYRLRHDHTDYDFRESLKFPHDLNDSTALQASLRALHLALGISYYKIFVSPHIEHPYEMDQPEADFWNEVWLHGLGEFLYVNKIPAERLAAFKAQAGRLIRDQFGQASLDNKALLGIGGGKDSIVAGELLKSCGVDVTGFVLATGPEQGQTQAVADTMKIDLLSVERVLDPKLLEVQERPGAYKGHVPISLIFGLAGTVLALLQKSSYIVVANEASASIPSARWEDRAVNHQWSKSFAFEQHLQSYVQSYICNRLTYFSAIRPLTSVAVAKIFATYSQYFEVFTSDNHVFRVKAADRPTSRWGLESAKSLSSFLLLVPWLPETDLLRIFERNFLDEPALEKLFLELTGLEGEPPLDCVGTVQELVASLQAGASQGKFTESHLMKLASSKGLLETSDWQAHFTTMLSPQPEQAFPPLLSAQLQQKIRDLLV